MATLTQNLKDRWLTALRTGLYRKSTGKLYRAPSDSYCVLGVLCEVAGKSLIEGDMDTLLTHKRYAFVNSVLGGGELAELIVLNDNTDSTFESIADYIENNIFPS